MKLIIVVTSVPHMCVVPHIWVLYYTAFNLLTPESRVLNSTLHMGLSGGKGVQC